MTADCICAAHGLAASRNMLCAEDVDALHTLARDLPPRAVVVDLGAGSGTTALAVLEARDDVSVVSVDSDFDAMNWTELAIVNAGHRTRWRRIIAYADEAKRTTAWWTSTSVDLLLHDAGHDREDVDVDLKSWWRFLAPGTPVWVHDYGVAKGSPEPAGGRYPGVKRAVDRLVREGLYTRLTTAGWGWIGVRA